MCDWDYCSVGGSSDAVGACAAGLTAAVCVGVGAGYAAAADGGGDDGSGPAAAAALQAIPGK
eukprot:1139159-Pelagomonas_calceolata.AAC.3